jgi:signal transduction histidine kinase
MSDRGSHSGVLALATMAREALGCDAVVLTGADGEAAVKVGEPTVVTALGQRSDFAAEATLDGRLLGAIHALTSDGRAVDRTLLRAFAAHFSVLLAGRGEGDSRPPTPAGTADALDRLLPSVSNFAELVPRVGAALTTIFGTVRCGLMTWDEEAGVLQLVRGSFGVGKSAAASYQVTVEDTRSNASRVFTLGLPYLTNDAQHDPAVLREYAEAFEIERLLTVPLVVGDRTIGVLHVADKATDFKLADITELGRLSPRIAVAVEMTRLLLRTRRQQRLDAVLAEVATTIARGDAGPQSLRAGLIELLSIAGGDTIVLTPAGAAPISATTRSDGKGSLEILVAQARDLQGERADVVSPRGAGDPGSAILHVPVRLGEERLGTLSACRTRGERFDADERIAFGRMANLASLAWAADEVAAQQGRVARLEERQRIADDLHDDVAQLLFAAQIQLEALVERPGLDHEAAAQIGRARALITRGDVAIRDVIDALSPPAPSDLADQLGELAEGIEEEFAISVRVEITPGGRAAAAAAQDRIKDTVARVAREALVNVAKHAGPCQASLRLDVRSDSLVLEIGDDGIGLAAGGEGHGLASLRRAVARRGGSLVVGGRDGGGTLVAASLPLPFG